MRCIIYEISHASHLFFFFRCSTERCVWRPQIVLPETFLPVETAAISSISLTYWHVQHVLEELRGGIENDWKGRDEVQEEHDLHGCAHGALTDGLHNVGLGGLPEGVVGQEGHREVDDEEN